LDPWFLKYVNPVNLWIVISRESALHPISVNPLLIHESDMFHLVVPFGIHDFVSRLGVSARMAPVAEAHTEEQRANGKQQAAEHG
jgi:hypothetical protein